MKITNPTPKMEIELSEIEALDFIMELSKKLAFMRSFDSPLQAFQFELLDMSLPKPRAVTIKFVIKHGK